MSSLHIAGVVAVATVWSVAAPPQSLSERLDAEIGRLAAEVAQGPAMELPPTPPGIPPPKVTRAGPEFVNAWQLAHRLLAIPLHDPAADGADSLANEMVGRMCGGAVFFALPPGTYEAAVPELRSAGDSLREPMRLPADSTTVTITAASPEVIVATDRLRICLEPE